MDSIESVPAPWRTVALVCGKCSRKLKGGFGHKGKHSLKGVLKDALRDAGRRREVRLVEVGCLNLCPRRAVSVVAAARPGEVLAVPAGTDPAEVLKRIAPAASRP